MKKYIKYCGLPLVYIGVSVLVISYLAGWSNTNALLFIGLFLIISGIAGHVYLFKKQSRY